MGTDPTPPPVAPPAASPFTVRRPSPAGLRLLGAALMLPALLALLVSYVEPTLWTVRTSFRRLDVLSGVAQQPWQANYRLVFERGYWGWVAFALSLALVPLLVAVLGAPLLAYAADRAGLVGRWATRAVLALPLVAYAPTALAAGWLVAMRGPADPRALVRTALWVTLAGAVLAVATTAYLAALRTRGRGRLGALLAVAGLAALATAAAALQEFTYPLVLTGGGPRERTMTPVLGQYVDALQTARFGPAAAMGTLTLAMLALLGLLAAVLVIALRLRITVEPGYRAPDEPILRARPTAVLAIALVAVLGFVGWALADWVGDLARFGPARYVANTWLPPLVSTVVGVGFAALAGFGIGALRPLGRWSEALLLPFAPWLFVGPGPLAMRTYAAGRGAAQLDSYLGLIPSSRLVIPALFVFTLLFAGQAQRWRERSGAGWFTAVVLPALPMVAIAGLVTWVVQAQNAVWPLTTGTGGRTTAQEAVLRAAQSFDRDLPVGLLSPLPLLLGMLTLAVAAQLAYLDRLALRAGRISA